jgi:inward rectifier potassium channel
MKRNRSAAKNEKESRDIPRSLFASMRESDRPDVVWVGDASAPIGDLYHSLIRMSWLRFITLFVLVFLFLNLIFAVFYTLDESGLKMPSSDRAMRFANAFFFSVHTIATVGYGNMYPIDFFTNVIVVIEITFGLLFFALGSGLTFARFSRPTARVLFSNVAVVTNFQNVPTLMVRAANQRHNFIFEANVRCSLLRRETIDGKEIRRYYDLKLDRASNPVFALSWLIMHHIDEASPLFGLDQNAFEATGDEIVVLLRGLDSSVAKSIQARWAYGPGNVLWDHEFVDVLSVDESGRVLIDFRRFHEVSAIGRKTDG